MQAFEAAGIAIMVALPRLTNAVPAPLVAIALLTAVTVFLAVNVPTVGDEAAQRPLLLFQSGLRQAEKSLHRGIARKFPAA